MFLAGFQHLTNYNFLKYDGGIIKVCPLPYSNHLRRYREPKLIRTLMKSLKKLPDY